MGPRTLRKSIAATDDPAPTTTSKVARSMAFAGEPVSEEMLREELGHLTQRRIAERNAGDKHGI